MKKATTMLNLKLSNNNPFRISSFKRHDNGTATVRVRALYSDDSYMMLSDGVTKLQLNEKFITKLHEKYNNSVKKKPILFGKTRYPSLLVDHYESHRNVRGRLNSPSDLIDEMIDGKHVKSIYVDILITDPDVADDLEKNGADSKYSKLSVGVEFNNGDIDDFELIELSLTDSPVKKHALMLSNNKGKLYIQDEKMHLKACAYQEAINNRVNAEKRLQEILDKKKTLNMKLSISNLLNKQVFLNKITRADKNHLMGKLSFNDNEYKLLSEVFGCVRSEKINTVSLFRSSSVE